jgi:hypothetical protein
VPEAIGGDGGRQASAHLDPGVSQRWARTATPCSSCGRALYQRPGSRDWVHSDTNLRFSNIGGAHLAAPAGPGVSRMAHTA